MTGEIQPKIFSYSCENGVESYTDGSRNEKFRTADKHIGLTMLILGGYSTKESPNMTKDEYYKSLDDLVNAEYTRHNTSQMGKNVREYRERVFPYLAEDSDGGTDVTVNEMMEIADAIKKEYSEDSSNKKPWYKFW